MPVQFRNIFGKFHAFKTFHGKKVEKFWKRGYNDDNFLHAKLLQ